jgi:hypothetical protein
VAGVCAASDSAASMRPPSAPGSGHAPLLMVAAGCAVTMSVPFVAALLTWRAGGVAVGSVIAAASVGLEAAVLVAGVVCVGRIVVRVAWAFAVRVCGMRGAIVALSAPVALLPTFPLLG